MDNFKFSDFEIGRKLGAGSFGEIFYGFNPKTNQEVAIKFESLNTMTPLLKYEGKLYKYLLADKKMPHEAKGIPNVYYCGTEGDKSVMVMDLLGPSLEAKFNDCNRKFSLETVLVVGAEMLDRITYLHSRYILHRDIKPENFLVGHGSNKDKIFLIDFGLYKKLVDKDGRHIPFKEGKSLTGTARYSSVNNHLGYAKSRRDDLESLAYIMIYFLRGNLPWQNVKVSNMADKYKEIKEKKIGTPIEVLCKGLPNEFVTFLSYCRNLKFEAKPDYAYLRSLIFDTYKKATGTNIFIMYDWDVLANKKKEKTEKEKKEEKYTELLCSFFGKEFSTKYRVVIPEKGDDDGRQIRDEDREVTQSHQMIVGKNNDNPAV